MADPKALETLKQRVQLWNENRESLTRDLSEADLRGAVLIGAHFEATNLAGSNLEGCDLSGATFGKEDSGANLRDTQLREAKLRGCDLSGVKGALQQQQLGGADLTGATLPQPLSKLFENLDALKGISESARKLFITMLVGCLYCWLTIATTTDVNLITNRAASALPVIGTSIPIVGFYVVAPLLLLCVYFYFHFYLQKLWEELGSLPAIFPDGRRLHERSDPWLLNDLVRAHLRLLRPDRPFMSYFQQAVSIVLAWWVVPVSLFLFWGRYLPRHDYYLTALQAVLLAASITAAVFLYRLAAATLRGAERQPFSWQDARRRFRSYGAAGTFLATGSIFMLLSVGAIRGFPTGDADWQTGYTTGRWSWVPRAMALVHYSPFANLVRTDVSMKPDGWTEKTDPELHLVKGAALSVTSSSVVNGKTVLTVRRHADLQHADAYRAFLAKANLSGTDLEGADLRFSDLRQAYAEFDGVHLNDADLTGATLREAHLPYSDLKDAWLPGADLTKADLSWSRLDHANLDKAILKEADLMFADFRSSAKAYPTIGLTVDALVTAKNWKKAYYDEDFLPKLGLPPDHNQELEAEEEQAKKTQPFPWSTPTW